MSGPQVYLTKPNFTLIPDSLPRALPPPVHEGSFRAPFGIDPWLFNFALKPEIPVTFAALYIVVVFTLNAYNRRRNHKRWWIARQSFFRWFVVIHNAILTFYSAATFLAMCRAIAHTWPGIDTKNGLAGAADALCKLHGPRGLGDAATYNSTVNIWEVKNTIIRLGYDGNPDPTDVGRLWNEGLAFWGWMFYVSKFYEVLDTLIILAKGKRSATLQTYHHSGAMLCMWAGIRFMSPPIWMFVFVNSFIHALMYTYFTLSSIGIKVPPAVKRILTSMQITQFVWGASYAAAHLFVQYDIPISTPYRVVATVQSAVSSASSAASAATSTVSKVIESPATSGTLIALIKKLLLRAVGEEGIAELVTNGHDQPFTSHASDRLGQLSDETHQKAQQKAHQFFETKWRTNWTKTNCIDTSGEAFAIYLNLLYLAPLTFLFLRFFVKAYIGRGKARRASHALKQVAGSAEVARHRTSETAENAGRKVEDEIIKAEAELQKVEVGDILEEMRRNVQDMKNGIYGQDDRTVSARIQDFERRVKSAAESVKERSKSTAKSTGGPRRPSPSKKQLDTQVIAQEASNRPQASGESKQKQDTNLEASEPKRPGGDTEDNLIGSTSVSESKSKRTDGLSYSQAVQEGASTHSIGDFSQSSTSHSESYSYSQSQETRTSSHEESQSGSVFGLAEDDTDAMGKSGAIVDFAAEKAENAREKAKEAAREPTKL